MPRRALSPALRCLVAAGVSGIGLGASALGQTYRFNSSTQGWVVYNIPAQGAFIGANPVSTGPAAHDAAGGVPAGSLRVTDLTSETWVGAPASALGNRADLYGQDFQFDVIYRTADLASYAAVCISGPTMSLFIAKPSPALNTWLHWSFPLSEGQWRVNSTGGAVATQAQVQAVLADLRGVFIHTEWTTGNDDTSLDNIALGPVTPCGLADIGQIGGTAEDPGLPDGQLTVDDIIAFINIFSDGTGCPDPAAPNGPRCNAADVTGIGGPPAASDGQLTVDDIIAFVNAFSDGCL